MNVDSNKFLVCNEFAVVFWVNPKTTEERACLEPKLDWLEAFKVIKNGFCNKELDQDVNWIEKYKKIISFRDRFLAVCSKIPSEELAQAEKYITIFSEISEELLGDIKKIFQSAHPLSQENISKAIYLHSEQKLLNLYKGIAVQLKVRPECKFASSMRDIDHEGKNPVRKHYKSENSDIMALPINVFKHYSQKNQFENSNWHPNQDITVLMKELKAHGPLLITGSFGSDFYSMPSHKLKHMVGAQAMWGWDQENKVFSPSLSNAKSLGEESHRVILIGARISKGSTGHVYIVDPSSNEEKIYVISLEGLRKRIRDIWNEIFLSDMDTSYLLNTPIGKSGAKFGLFCKSCISPQNQLQVSNNSSENSTWQQKYEALIEAQGKCSLHPLSDPPEHLIEVKNKFMEIFDKAPEEKRRQLVKEPLFPLSTKFKKLSRDSAKPLNYIMFCGDFEALKKIAPYLNPEDYLALGPYDSTFMHCLISGFQKRVIKLNFDPGSLECAKFLLEKAPELAVKKNNLGTTPLSFAKEVLKTCIKGPCNLNDVIILLETANS